MAPIFNNPLPGKTNETLEYEIVPKKGVYTINVKLPELGETQIKVMMLEETEKSSLMGMAFIHKLASENHQAAQDISRLYSGYHQIFKTNEKKELHAAINHLLKDQQSGELAKEAALYLKQVLGGEPLTFSEGRRLIEGLMPSIYGTLTIPQPKKVYTEQEVRVSEMQASHYAFPDLIKFKGLYYVCFREGNAHVKFEDLGSIRILKGEYNPTAKTWAWKNDGLITHGSYDLRDPKFFTDSHDNLRMIVGGSLVGKKDRTRLHIPYVAVREQDQWNLEEVIIDAPETIEFADADDASEIKARGQWIWSVTWNKDANVGYAFSYRSMSSKLSLVKTLDGKTFHKITEVSSEALDEKSKLFDENDARRSEFLNEATIRFKTDGTAISLIRTSRHGLIGVASPANQHVDWSLNVVPFRLGGPNFIMTKDQSNMWAGTRHFFLNGDNSLDETTILAYMDQKQLVPLLELKSHLDCGYPGMVVEENGNITMVYYSSKREGETAIYIVRIEVPQVDGS